MGWASEKGQLIGGRVDELAKGLVVEVDGPAHCAADDPSSVLGGTLLRNTLLHALGWQVIWRE